MSDIEAGIYKGRAIKESAQYGQNENTKTDQLVLELHLPSLQRNVQTFLYFSEKAFPFTVERLRACGWKGDNILDLTGVDENDVDVEIKYETYNEKRQMRVNILTGGGRVQIQQFSDGDKRAFAARVSAMMGKKPEAQTMPGTNFDFGANAPPPK